MKHYLTCDRCGKRSPYPIEDCLNGGLGLIGNELVCSDCLGKKEAKP